MTTRLASQHVLELADRLLAGTPDAALEGEVAQALSALDGEARLLAQRVVQLARERGATRKGLVQTAKLSEVGLAFAEMVHELRQPLSSISGFAQLLGPKSSAREVGDGVREILVQCDRMSAMLERLRRFIKSEDEGQPKIVDVDAALRSALALFPRMPPGVVLDVQIAPGLGKVVAEEQELVQVILNLLANARWAQEQQGPGTVALRAERQGDAVAITVADEGCGLAPGFAERLFEPFATTRGEAGTGLGLYICREILASWDGQIALLSPAPRPYVTAFAVRLQSVERRDASAARAGLAQSAGEIAVRVEAVQPQRRVLVVDDQAGVRRVLKVLLSAEDGVELAEAADGPEALRLLEAQPAQVLVVDRGLPGMNGLELIRRARAERRVGQAVLVTGYPSPASVAEAINAGACDYLVKPIDDAEALRSVVRAALERERLRQIAEALGAELRPWATRALESARDGGAGAAMLTALKILSQRPEGPAPIGVVGERALVAPLAVAGHRAEGPWSRSQALDALARGEVEALVVGEGLAPAEALELAQRAKAAPWPPALVWAQAAGDFNAMLSLLRAGAAAVLERPIDGELISQVVARVCEERRQRQRILALGVVLEELGLARPAAKVATAAG